MPCNYKGLNLFYSQKIDNEWTNPRPLNGVNSDANEVFPALHKSDLYFSV